MLSFFGSKGARTEAPAPAAAATPPAAPATEGEQLSKETGIVLDAITNLLQLYAKYAFDTELRSADEIRSATQA